MLAFRGVRETLRQKQVADDHSHWWDQTKWAFDLVMSPNSSPEDLQMAGRTLIRQARASDLPDSDLEVALEMVDRAIAKEADPGEAPTGPYDEQQEGGGTHGQAR